MKLRDLPKAEELSTDWNDMLMEYIFLIEHLTALEENIKNGVVQSHIEVLDFLEEILDEEATG